MKVAKTYVTPDGMLTFTMLPYRTILTNVLISDMEVIVPRKDWRTEMHGFCLFVGATLEIEVADIAPDEAKAVAEYWEQCKNLPTGEKWQFFQRMVSQDMYYVWYDAYDTTRTTPPPAPEIIQQGEPNDPNSDGSGGTLTEEKS